MITKRNKQIKKQLGAPIPHLKLHRPAALKCAPRADDERKVVCPQLGVCVGGVGVGVPGRGEDGAALDS